MLKSPAFWMSVAGLVSLFAGLFLQRKEIAAARGWDRLISLGCLFIAVSLAIFAPEHFRGPQYVQSVVPKWMPVRWFWPFLVGCALLAAATSLTVKVWVRWSSTLLAVMLTLFVCMIHVENVFAQPHDRFVWTVVLRDLSFAGGAWALAGLYFRDSSLQLSKGLIAFGRIVIGVAAIFFAVQHFLHPRFAPGVPLEKMSPAWIPLPILWAYVTGAILLGAGFCLVVNKQSRVAAAWIGALVTVLTLAVYSPGLFLVHGVPTGDLIEALNYVADTLLYAGAALVLASALPHASALSERVSLGSRGDLLAEKSA